MRTSIIITFLLFFSANDVSAQVDIKLSPFGSFLPLKDLAIIEYVPHKRVGVEAKFGISRGYIDQYNELALDITLIQKFYLFPRHRAERLYIGAWLRGGRQNFASTQNALWYYSCSTLGVGPLLGYKQVWNSRFLVDVNLGPGKILLQKFNFSDDFPDYSRDIIVTLYEATVEEYALTDAIVTLSVGYRIFKKEAKSE